MSQRELHGADYVARFAQNQSQERLARLLARIDVGPDDTVADFGCGNGMLMPLLAPRVARYVGVDFSPEFIAAAEARRRAAFIANAELHCAAFEDFARARPDAFDAGFALDLSEHVPDADWLVALRAIRAALRPGAPLYLHTPNADFFLERMKARNFIVRQFPEHVAVRTADANAALLAQAGFEVARIDRLPHYNVLRLVHPLSRLPGIGAWFEARLFIEARRPR